MRSCSLYVEQQLRTPIVGATHYQSQGWALLRFGHFDDAHREYVVLRPDTPQPWINYLGADDFISIISNTGGGYAFYRDARLRRLTRYRYDNPPMDSNGRYLYIRDNCVGAYWCPSWQPARIDLDKYSCRHGLGYTIIQSASRDIEVETSYFVPLGETLEIWSMRITNRRAAPAQLSVFSAVEFCLWDALSDATNFQRNLNIGEVAVDGNSIIHYTEYRERRNHFATFSCSDPIEGFDTQRESFLGPYRGWDKPQAVERGTSTRSIAVGGSPIGAHHVRLTLQPGETRSIVYILGYHQDQTVSGERAGVPELTQAHRTIDAYMNPNRIRQALDDLANHWESRLSGFQVQTNDPAFDRMVNTWNAYQCATTYRVSRSASGFESGIGRGIGFRDANQDLLGCVHMIPDKARSRILDLASTQLVSGGAYHQYQPLTRKGNDAIGGEFNDDPLWLIYSTAAYMKETGDWSILGQAVAYGDDSNHSEPLYNHLLRAADYTLSRLGPHGLPLIGRADWNDCLNLNCHSLHPDEPFQVAPVRAASVAESVFIGALFCLACQDLIEIASRRFDSVTAERLSAADTAMRASLSQHGWDGEWFLRAYDAQGEKVGSKDNAEGRIFIETQGLCPMASIGMDDGRALRALDSVHEQLATEHGLLLLQPAYKTYHPELGEISSYPPGYKENGSVFCHTNPWIVIAECALGRADRAWDYAMRINPAQRESISNVHVCEPYVYAQMIAGRDAADHGRARNSWLTGTASWAYVAATQWILGIRASFDGLIIDPCLPKSVKTCRVVRQFRGAIYDIHISNPANDEPVSVEVDGTTLAGQVLPVFNDGKRHAVTVKPKDES